jgi:hypothetical protein
MIILSKLNLNLIFNLSIIIYILIEYLLLLDILILYLFYNAVKLLIIIIQEKA